MYEGLSHNRLIVFSSMMYVVNGSTKTVRFYMANITMTRDRIIFNAPGIRLVVLLVPGGGPTQASDGGASYVNNCVRRNSCVDGNNSLETGYAS